MPEWMKWLRERGQKKDFVDGRMDLGAGPVEPVAEDPDCYSTGLEIAEDLEAAVSGIESNGEWLDELYQSRVVDITDEHTPLPLLEDLAPPPIDYVPPPGAVHNGEDIYENGRRCLVPGCGLPSVADVCSRCAMKGGGNDAA